jgi:tetratricopeptide (TPR) repeat protein
MTKSNRRRKLDRAKRQARVSQNHAAAHRRQATEETIRDALERYDRLVNPGTPAAELADLLGEQYGGSPVSSVLVDRILANGSSPERLAGVAEVMLAAGASGEGPPSLTTLTFAAAAARAVGDAARARELLDQALTGADDPDVRVDLAQHLRMTGRLADALELVEARLRDAPEYDRAAER